MPDTFTLHIGVYGIAVSLFALVLTAYDKHAARIGSRRIREHTLLLVSVIGGSVAMFAAMRVLRHKTKHLKFMAGIPVIIVLQITAAFFWWRLKGGIL